MKKRAISILMVLILVLSCILCSCEKKEEQKSSNIYSFSSVSNEDAKKYSSSSEEKSWIDSDSAFIIAIVTVLGVVVCCSALFFSMQSNDNKKSKKEDRHAELNKTEESPKIEIKPEIKNKTKVIVIMQVISWLNCLLLNGLFNTLLNYAQTPSALATGLFMGVSAGITSWMHRKLNDLK